jgi:hypothetical protein
VPPSAVRAHLRRDRRCGVGLTEAAELRDVDQDARSRGGGDPVTQENPPPPRALRLLRRLHGHRVYDTLINHVVPNGYCCSHEAAIIRKRRAWGYGVDRAAGDVEVVLGVRGLRPMCVDRGKEACRAAAAGSCEVGHIEMPPFDNMTRMNCGVDHLRNWNWDAQKKKRERTTKLTNGFWRGRRSRVGR